RAGLATPTLVLAEGPAHVALAQRPWSQGTARDLRLSSRASEHPHSIPARLRPMVILHVVAPAEFGGLEEVVRALAGGLRERGHDAHVAAIVDARTGEHAFCRALTARGVPVHQVVVPPRAYLKERRAIAELCARLRPDVVHTHGYRPDVVDAGVARHLRLPVVT